MLQQLALAGIALFAIVALASIAAAALTACFSSLIRRSRSATWMARAFSRILRYLYAFPASSSVRSKLPTRPSAHPRLIVGLAFRAEKPLANAIVG